MTLFNLDSYLAELGNNPIYHKGEGKQVLEALGLSGLSLKRSKNRSQATRDMYARLLARFPQIGSEQQHAWRATTPCVKGREISIATLVLIELGKLSIDLDPFIPEVTEAYSGVLFRGDRGVALVEMLMELEIYMPPTQLRQLLDKWLLEAIRGKHSTVFMTVCPDYSHEDGKYTFTALWNGIGLVAERSVEVVRRFHAYAQRFDMDLHFIVAMADFEAECEKNRRCVGNISVAEFRARCRDSTDALRKELERRIPGIESRLQTPFISELSADWTAIYNEAVSAVACGNTTGPYALTGIEMAQIVSDRTEMNKVWASGSAEAFNPVAAVLKQAPDYGAVGAVAFREVGAKTNVLVIGLDSVSMAPFLHMLLPECGAVAYMKRVNY